MTLGDSAVDDPQTLYRLVSSAQPSLSRVGCAIDTSDAFFRRAGISRKIQSVGKQERERLVQLQRECQKAWDVAAECRLILPELRTMAPSCTKAANDGNNELGGTIIEGVGYNTIVDMIPTAETIQHIEENDELISSFRPYLIDALRAERSAKKTSEDAPHPDDTRQLETTLVTFPGNRLIDFEAVNVEAAECQQWAAGSTFTAAIIPEDQLVTFPMGPKAAAHSTRGKSLRSGLRSATPTFRRAQRFHDGNLLPGVRHPELGHYHLRFSQVEPRVVGGYIARQRPPTPETPVVEETFQDIKKVVENPTSSIHGAESVKDFTVSVTCRAPENVYIMRERLPPPKAGSWVFRSKALRSDAGTQSAAKDLEYFPYADVRSTVKRSRCPATFAYTVTERRREAVAAAATVGMYDIVGDIAQNPHRIVCMDRESTREKHWLNKAPPHTMAPDFADVDKAVRAVKQRTVTC
uniref:Uncharacterized protein TCIL3000_9_470 n=1 Tax=Trypanosoma congolense (strain IL3000) TaxID=1068625 RepID=G0UTD9_TRYCI|nr:unnamed protein product [Trypanosoma congolense IL3000]